MDIARKIGYSKTVVSDYINGKKIPSRKFLDAFNAAFPIEQKEENILVGVSTQIKLTGGKVAELIIPRQHLTKTDIEILKMELQQMEMSLGVDIDHSITEDTEKILKKKHNQN